MAAPAVADSGREGGAAEAQLVEQLTPRLMLFALRHYRRTDLVDDAVQEALFATVLALREGRVRDTSAIGPFALGVLRNRLRHQARTEIRQRELLELHPPPPPIVDPTTADVQRGRLEGCLGRLPERERNVIRLSFFEGAAPQTIATELTTTLDNIRVIRHRAMARLRACITDATPKGLP